MPCERGATPRGLGLMASKMIRTYPTAVTMVDSESPQTPISLCKMDISALLPVFKIAPKGNAKIMI